MHAMMAFVGAGRERRRGARARGAGARRWRPTATTPTSLRDVGLAATRAVQAFGRRRYARRVQLLRPMRSEAHRFGGSHAQRDLIDLTLIEAAERGGEHDLADALRREREMPMP